MYRSFSAPAHQDKTRQSAEARYARGPWTVQAEYLWGRDGTTDRRGGYALGVWRWSKKWEGIARDDWYTSNVSQAEHQNPDLAGRSELLPVAESAHSGQRRLAPGAGVCPVERGFPDAIADGILSRECTRINANKASIVNTREPPDVRGRPSR